MENQIISLSSILKSKGNDKCLDCGTEDPQFISINNGVFICFNCAAVHKTLGDEISKLQNISEELDEAEIKLMHNGGNDRFLQNLVSFELVKNNNHLSLNENKIKQKYLYKASEFYRRLLEAEVNNLELPERPENQIGKQFIEGYEVSKDKEKGVFSKIGGFFSSTANKAKDKIENLHIKDKLKSAGNKTVSVMKDAGAFIKEKAVEVKESQFGQKVSQTTDKGIDKIKGLFSSNKDKTDINN